MVLGALGTLTDPFGCRPDKAQTPQQKWSLCHNSFIVIMYLDNLGGKFRSSLSIGIGANLGMGQVRDLTQQCLECLPAFQASRT